MDLAPPGMSGRERERERDSCAGSCPATLMSKEKLSLSEIGVAVVRIADAFDRLVALAEDWSDALDLPYVHRRLPDEDEDAK